MFEIGDIVKIQNLNAGFSLEYSELNWKILEIGSSKSRVKSLAQSPSVPLGYEITVKTETLIKAHKTSLAERTLLFCGVLDWKIRHDV